MTTMIVMKTMSSILILILFLSVSCKDHDMFGTIEVSVNTSSLPSQTGAYAAGLFDPDAYLDYNDALYETVLVAGKGEFKDVNPGNYIVVVQNTTLHQGVQVKAGKSSSVRID